MGHDGFKIEHNKKIIIDPFKIKESDSADIILITHDHYDHCSIEDLKKVVKEDTVIFLPADCLSSLAGRVSGKTVVVEPGQKLNLEDITIETVPAYNINKQFHPKENNWNGYIITINGVRIYHAGDTDKIPEMNNFNVDVALVPVSGTYVMTAEEAAQAVNKMIKPKLAIPMHYGELIGTVDDAKKFAELAKCDVKILKK